MEKKIVEKTEEQEKRSKKGRASRNKGKVGERELSKKLRELGFGEARRSQQYCGTESSADIVNVPYLHIECKRVENLNVDKALDQAISDAGLGCFPVVMHRKNGREWRITMQLEDFVEIYKAYLKGR